MPEDLEPEPGPPPGVQRSDWVKSQGFVKQRLEYIRGLMSRLLYDSKKHDKILCEKWDIREYQLHQLTAEAARQLDLVQGNNSPRARETFVTILLQIAEEARAIKQYIPAVTAITKAAELAVEPWTKKIDITQEVKLMSDEELAEAYKKELEAGKRLLGTGKNIPDAIILDDTDTDEFANKSTEEKVRILKESPETPRNADGDRITPLMPEEDDDKAPWE